jgi:membrane-bound lytic murein transglycosylase D
VLRPDLRIRARFWFRATGFLFVLASGTVSLATAELLPTSANEDSARLPLRDGVMSIDSSVEPFAEEGGSAAEEAVAMGDRTWYPKVEADPWAEAFAESSVMPRVVAAPPPAPAPGYHTPINQQVQFFLDRFTRERREVVGKWFGRAGRYLEMIRDTLRDRGLPEDLAFVAMIESGFNPLAVSRAGAKGLWQFMAGTARRYGLRVDQWVDERFDPEKSTSAAASYLRDLYAQFGSWSLAQAAYNAGERTVERAIGVVGSTDFWALARSSSLRQETKEFVPQIHAATVIGQDPSRYGFDVASPSPTDVEFVSVPPGTNLTAIGTAAGVSTETLRSLNPALVKGVTPPGAPYRLRVPTGTSAAIQAALAGGKPLPERHATVPTAKGHTHVVKSGDTFRGIARRYGVSAADVMRWNNRPASHVLRPGERLVIAEVRMSARHGATATR